MHIVRFLWDTEPPTTIPLIGSGDVFFNFLMLCHWLASHDGFSIKCQQVLRTHLNSFKTSFQKATKLKIKLKCVVERILVFFRKQLAIFFRKKEILNQNIPLHYSYFSQFGEILDPIKTLIGSLQQVETSFKHYMYTCQGGLMCVMSRKGGIREHNFLYGQGSQ